MAVTEKRIDSALLAEDRSGVLRLLEQAARTIDHMWRTAQYDGEHAAAVALGEASHGVHRALIALQTSDSLV